MKRIPFLTRHRRVDQHNTSSNMNGKTDFRKNKSRALRSIKSDLKSSLSIFIFSVIKIFEQFQTDDFQDFDDS